MQTDRRSARRSAAVSFTMMLLAIAACQRASSFAPCHGRQRLLSLSLCHYPTVLVNVPNSARERVQGFSTKRDDEETISDNVPSNIEYRSRSTNDPEISATFHAGYETRKARLHAELQSIGLDPDELVELPEFRGSAALRTYNSFVLPNSAGALAMADRPSRAAVVANSISFLLREHKAHQEEWLRNHDRTIQEVASQWKGPRNPISLVLDDIRSAHNVGNILRFAEAARCRNVWLCGSMTPAPPHPKVLKTALGAAEYVPYETAGSTLQAIRQLQKQGIRVYAVETTSRSVSLWKVSFFEKRVEGDEALEFQQIAFVFGNELVGVAIEVLEECDGIVSVPTHGIKNSLNVATCASVVTWEALRQLDAAQGG